MGVEAGKPGATADPNKLEPAPVVELVLTSPEGLGTSTLAAGAPKENPENGLGFDMGSLEVDGTVFFAVTGTVAENALDEVVGVTILGVAVVGAAGFEAPPNENAAKGEEDGMVAVDVAAVGVGFTGTAGPNENGLELGFWLEGGAKVEVRVEGLEGGAPKEKVGVYPHKTRKQDLSATLRIALAASTGSYR
jgi:hypothetical protein